MKDNLNNKISLDELQKLIEELNYDISDLSDMEILAACTGTCSACNGTCTSCQGCCTKCNSGSSNGNS